jgi:hypothetical protein
LWDKPEFREFTMTTLILKLGISAEGFLPSIRNVIEPKLVGFFRSV